MPNSNEAPKLSIVPPSSVEQPSGTVRQLQAADDSLGAGAHYAHLCGPEDAVGKVPVSGRLIIASNLLPWELSLGKGGEWVSHIALWIYRPKQLYWGGIT